MNSIFYQNHPFIDLRMNVIYYYVRRQDNICIQELELLQVVMKKVRILKKNPNRILRTLEIENPLKQSIPHTYRNSFNSNPLSKNAIINDYRRSSLQAKTGNYSHRYKNSSPDDKLYLMRKTSISPNKQKNTLPAHHEQKIQHIRHGLRLSQQQYRQSQNSPYLLTAKNNKSSKHFLIVTARRMQQDPSISKQQKKQPKLRTLRKRANSQELRSQEEDNLTLKQAKQLMLKGENNKSIFLLKRILKKDADNYDAQYILCLNLFNLGDSNRVISLAKKLITQKQQQYSYLHYILVKSYSMVGKHAESYQHLKQYQNLFPNQISVQIEIGSYHLEKKDYEKAIQYYKKALKINPSGILALEKLFFIFNTTDLKMNILELIQHALISAQNDKLLKLNQIKTKILFKLGKYQDIIRQYKQSTDAQILYYLAMAYFKLNQSLKAYLIAQSCLSASEDCTEIYKLMLMIKINQKNFYEAMHLIQRKRYLNIKQNEIQLQQTFINGVVFLIRREIVEGVNQLEKIYKRIIQQKSDNQIVSEISNLIHGFIAYGHYYLNNYKLCKQHYRLQKQIAPGVLIQNMQYNVAMNEGFLLSSELCEEEAVKYFQKASELNMNRLEPSLCLAITYFKIHYKNKQTQKTVFEDVRQNFHTCLKFLNKLHNNAASIVFFHKCLFHAYLQQWRDAIICIDQAIQRAEENYWKHFYVRALIFGCLHNFGECLNDCTIAINLNKNKADLYFLRASCFQIEGQGSQAFQDLQCYIALRPEDVQIHKFAGKLLFENGAFEDAIKAFSHEPIKQIIDNYDAFLTKCKTHFLLGQFNFAALQMQKIYKLDSEKKHLLFDAQMMKITEQLINIKIDRNSTMLRVEKHFKDNFDEKQKNNIFKETQLHTYKAVCKFQLGEYQNALKQFQWAIKIKQKLVVRETLIEGINRQDERDTKLYLAQMKFNISLCYLCLGNSQSAKCTAQKIEISPNQNFYGYYQSFLGLFTKKKEESLQKQSDVKKVQVFSSRNKISHYLPEFTFQLNSQTFYSRLCIPFPKVQPPQIFPNFDQKIFHEVSVEGIQKKPEAPWITRQMDSINFTGKIERYSRLEIQDSVGETSVEDIATDNSHISLKSLSSRRVKISFPEQYHRNRKRSNKGK